MKAISPNVFSIAYKLFFAFLGFSALVTEIVASLERGVFNPANFFSYFTVQVNILVMFTLVIGAVALALGKARSVDTLRSAVAVYIWVVGIGFSILLANLEGITLTAVPWDNTVLHYIIPLAIVGDLLIDRPRQLRRFAHNLVWLIYPLAYLVYSMVRGAATGWYPYPFLNPATNGYASVAMVAGALLILGIGIVWVVTCYVNSSKRSKLA